VLPHGAGPGKARKIGLPVQGSIILFSAAPEVDGAIFSLEPWTAPMTLMRASVARPVAVDAGLITAKGEPYKDIVAVEASCPARDGAKVPVSILMKKNLARDGSNPAILYGYGGYGFTETADFSATRLAFLERGGILAIANPRGSGAYGEDWYQAGRGATKANTWRDMIDCAEMLVRERYTSPSKLGLRGVSMGGLMAGRVLTERPDLFATAVVQVGMLDAVRTIVASQNGPNHLLEMGDVKTEAGIRQLLDMSSYHSVRDGAKYPAVLITTGVNDNRVEPWMSYKMAARLQAASASGKPVLLRVDDKGGHGVSTTAMQRNATTADYYAFHLWQTGDPAFQPK
jgi:prolyl oligopeptidase